MKDHPKRGNSQVPNMPMARNIHACQDLNKFLPDLG